jgi:3-methyl-2-oxobutanoate hydroxymethyltransferase
MKPVTIRNVLRRKGKRPLSMLTAYDYPTACVLEEAGVDMILVGDSVGNVVLGLKDTISVTMDDMVRHCAAVSRGAPTPLVVGDMPFLTGSQGNAEAVRAAGRLLAEGGAQAVKLEGGSDYAETVHAIVRAGIPVMAHIGLTPQFVHQLGGYRYQGKTEKSAEKLLQAAKDLEDAGAFSIVLECVPEKVAGRITEALRIPTIGIGAGEAVDGQVLVFHDLLGLNAGHVPAFVKPTADLRSVAVGGVKQWLEAVEKKESTPELGANPSAEGAV